MGRRAFSTSPKPGSIPNPNFQYNQQLFAKFRQKLRTLLNSLSAMKKKAAHSQSTTHTKRQRKKGTLIASPTLKVKNLRSELCLRKNTLVCQILYLRECKLFWERHDSLQKCFIDKGKRFSKATLMLLFLSVLMLAVIVMPVTKAQSASITIIPSQGPAGEMVSVYIHNFPQDSPVSITFGTTSWGSPTTDYGGNIDDLVTVPSVSPGTYTVTATGTGGVAKTTFTVTGSTPAPTTAPLQLSPTSTPITVNAGFWSPLTIAITAVVVAFAVFMTAFYLRRDKQKPLSHREDSRYEPRPSTPAKTPYTASSTTASPTSRPVTNSSYQPSTNRPATKSLYQPYQTSKVNQSATKVPQPAHTIVCKHCKRTVRDDLNICPYCSKKLK